MNAIPRITSGEVRNKMIAGEDVLFVCSHEDEKECKNGIPQEAIPLREFMSETFSLPTHQEIVFFCDSPDRAISKERAEKFKELGFENVKVLEGGLSAWREGLINRNRNV